MNGKSKQNKVFQLQNKIFQCFIAVSLCLSFVFLSCATVYAAENKPSTALEKEFVEPMKRLDFIGDCYANKDAKFRGRALYRYAAEVVRDSHITLREKAKATAWYEKQMQIARTDKRLETEEGVDEAIAEMLAGLGQRFDFYFNRAATKKIDEDVKGELFGIGVVMQEDSVEKDADSSKRSSSNESNSKSKKVHGSVSIVDVIENSPAEKAGITEGWTISSVDGKDVQNAGLEKVCQLIKGERGSPVNIALIRGKGDKAETCTKSIVRDLVEIKVVKTSLLPDGIAYVKIKTFHSQKMSAQLRQGLQSVCPKAKGILLDLRGNSGGFLSAGEDTLRYLLSSGYMLRIMSRSKDSTEITDTFLTPDSTQTTTWEEKADGQLTPKVTSHAMADDNSKAIVADDMPMVVLIDEHSASASEIVAGSLQANHRATIVGKPSWGKGVGQFVNALPYGRSMNVIGFEFLPGGQKVDWSGVIPDLEVKSSAEEAQTKIYEAGLAELRKQISQKELKSKRSAEMFAARQKSFAETLTKRAKKK